MDYLTMDDLLNKKEDKTALSLPKDGDLVEGTVIKIGRSEIYLDLDGIKTGVIRGPELQDELDEYTDLKIGDIVSATIIEQENEKGLVELSFRRAGHKKAWQKLQDIMTKNESINVKVLDANAGGLIIQLGKITGFLPTSQLNPDHYPLVESGDKTKIIELLKKFVGQQLPVKIIGLDENEDKLIVSEKELNKGQNISDKYKIGDDIEGEICGLANFGAFVKFDNQEGLVHISEIAWRRLDHPTDILKIGDKIKAQIIGVENGKFSLSMKKLMTDPWKIINDKYKIGDIVEGKILKVNPFGLFVELNPEIHGLAHISEISEEQIGNLTEMFKSGDVQKFKIISLEPDDHRLGLSLKSLKNN